MSNASFTQLILISIALLAIIGWVLCRRGWQQGNSTPHTANLLLGSNMWVAPTKPGLEIFVPSDQKVLHNIELVVNDQFRTIIDSIGPGITRIPRSSLIDNDGQEIRATEQIFAASFRYGTETSVFRWRLP